MQCEYKSKSNIEGICVYCIGLSTSKNQYKHSHQALFPSIGLFSGLAGKITKISETHFNPVTTQGMKLLAKVPTSLFNEERSKWDRFPTES